MIVHGRECVSGVDISNHQNAKGPINYLQAATHVEFLVAKATEGVNYADPYYRLNRDGWLSTGKVFGAYHWLKPNWSWRDQAVHFLRYTEDARGCDFIACDAEEAGLTNDQIIEWCRMVQGVTHKPVVIYCGAFTDPQVREKAWLEFTPWLAAYGPNRPGQNPATMSPPRPPAPWGRWDIWQYTSVGQVPDIPGGIDVNVADVKWFSTLRPNTPLEENNMAEIQDNQDGLDAIAARVRDFLVSSDPTINPGVVVSPQIYTALTTLLTHAANPDPVVIADIIPDEIAEAVWAKLGEKLGKAG